MRILFVASEGLPFSKTGGLADVVEALPKALVASGHEVAVVLPRYRGIKVTAVAAASVTISTGNGLRFPSIADGGVLHGVQYLFVDDARYFDRDQLYGEGGRDYPDNAERFDLFSRAAIEVAKQLWRPQVIHCHDWQAALVPVLLRALYSRDPAVQRLPVVFTVHNLGYQGLFPRDVLARLALPESLFHVDALEFYGKVNLLKGGLVFSDYLTTVSRKYAEEIQTAEYGHGLEGVIQARADRLVGILNGVDYSVWSPDVDAYLAKKYSLADMSGKEACKRDLLAQFKLPAANIKRPLVGIISRFADQKGFDLIAQIAADFLKEDVCLVALGTGEPKYEALFRALAEHRPERVGVRVGFDNALAHKIEAGADLFLMPSRYEPCGLNQIYSLRYGAVPVVRATGGLDDTIEAFQPLSARGTGFKFQEYDGKALLETLRQAIQVFRDPPLWRKLVANGMAKDFSWTASAAEYARLYDRARRSAAGSR
jgi:starch synthase